MPNDLSPPLPRELVHLRDITIRGYQRADGLFDIEAHLVDTKTYAFANEDRGGRIEAGEPLHEMKFRLTVDAELTIVDSEAATLHAPYRMCPAITPNFARLAGLRIGRGFLKAARERVGGVHGCTHLVELLQQLGTTAFQTLSVVRRRAGAPGTPAAGPARPPALLNTCHTYAADSPVVQRRWPEFYRGEAAADQPSGAAAMAMAPSSATPER